MRYLKGADRYYRRGFLSEGWGEFTLYLEIDDQLVVREVHAHESGQLLRYDRSHWCDDFGMMHVGRFSRKQKASRDYETITPEQFERIWRLALRSELWPQQVARSREPQWGSWQDRFGT